MSLLLSSDLNRPFHVPTIASSMLRPQAVVCPLLELVRRQASTPLRRPRGLQASLASPRDDAFATDAYQEVGARLRLWERPLSIRYLSIGRNNPSLPCMVTHA